MERVGFFKQLWKAGMSVILQADIFVPPSSTKKGRFGRFLIFFISGSAFRLYLGVQNFTDGRVDKHKTK